MQFALAGLDVTRDTIYLSRDTIERVSAIVGIACTRRTIARRSGRRRPPNTSPTRPEFAGPTLKDMFEVMRRHMPPTDIVRLLDMVVVNVLACNTDAHAKNDPWQRRVACADVRRHVRRSLGERHEELRAKDCRQKQGQ